MRLFPIRIILILVCLFPASALFAGDYLLVINTSGHPEEAPRFIGSYEHLPFERSGAPEGLDNPVESTVTAPFRPEISLSPGDEEHLFLVEEENGIYEIEGRLVYGDEASRCLIYVEKNSKFREGFDWKSIGRFFDLKVYPSVRNNFGRPGDVDGNGKVVILYYPFPDDTMLGYFSSGDLVSRQELESSNEMEILYMNSDYGNPLSRDMMETLPHEFMHLVNYSQRQRQGFQEMDVWMDEGLAECATDLVMRRVLRSNMEVFRDPAYSPWTNSALCAWGEMDEDYALSYLFMQYLRAQAGTADIFKKMIRHPMGTAFSLPKIMREYVPEFKSFRTILKSFYLALVLDEPDGIYGFKGMRSFDRVEPRFTKPSFDGYLYPGGAVYLPLPEGEIKTVEDPEKHIMVIDTRDFRRG